MNYRKFDLKRALAGEPVVLHDGSKAYVRHHEEELNVLYPLSGYISNEGSATPIEWREDGCHPTISGKSNIIGMWREKLVAPDIVWQVLHPEVVAIAMDASGNWYAHFDNVPHKNIIAWVADGRCHKLDAIVHLLPDVHWEDSLILRPKGVSNDGI